MKVTIRALLVAGALAATLVTPVFGHDLTASGGCREGDVLVPVAFGDAADRNQDLVVCETANGRRYDNHLHTGGGGGWTDTGCREGDTLRFVALGTEADRNEDLAVCETASGRQYDNRLPTDGGGGGGWTDTGCREGDTLRLVVPGHEADRNEDLAVCETSSGRFYDNR